LGRPMSEQLVAPSVGLKSQLLVMRELLLEAFLAFVERGHAALVVLFNGRAERWHPYASGLAYRLGIAKSTIAIQGARAASARRLCSATRWARFGARGRAVF